MGPYIFLEAKRKMLLVAKDFSAEQNSNHFWSIFEDSVGEIPEGTSETPSIETGIKFSEN